MKKLILFSLILISANIFAGNIVTKKDTVTQVAGSGVSSDTLMTIVKPYSDSVLFKTDKKKFVFNKSIKSPSFKSDSLFDSHGKLIIQADSTALNIYFPNGTPFMSGRESNFYINDANGNQILTSDGQNSFSLQNAQGNEVISADTTFLRVRDTHGNTILESEISTGESHTNFNDYLGNTVVQTFNDGSVSFSGYQGNQILNSDNSGSVTLQTVQGNPLIGNRADNSVYIRGKDGNYFIDAQDTANTFYDPNNIKSFELKPDNIIVYKSININEAQLIANGTTGTATYSEPFSGNSYKKVIIYLNNFVSVSGVFITFPTSFVQFPNIIGSAISAYDEDSSSSYAISLKSSTPVNGFIILEGY